MSKIISIIKKLKFYLIIILLYVCFLSFVSSFVYIPTGSMEPTIKEGSYAIEFRFPFIFTNSPPVQKGDIISFDHPESTHTLCKRVIGVEGDKISFLNGDVYINGQKMEDDYCRYPHTSFSERTFEVPEGCVFCMGDNRENSKDSRSYNNPYIKINDIKGKILFSFGAPKWICGIIGN